MGQLRILFLMVLAYADGVECWEFKTGWKPELCGSGPMWNLPHPNPGQNYEKPKP
jgi:hypothetical protein